MVDTHKNITVYRYNTEANYYAAGPSHTLAQYTRGGTLRSITYAQRTPDYVAKTTTGVQVLFTSSQRCDGKGGFDCTTPISKTNASHWPDVPYDQNCASSGACTNYAPTFWSTLALSKITTRIWDVSLATPAWSNVDTYTMSAPAFPDPGDFGQGGGDPTPALWLDSVTHAGVDTRAGGAAVTLDPVTFKGVAYPNRVRGLNITGVPPINRFRLNTITSETGSPTVIDYQSDDSCNRDSPPTEDNDDQRCFPKRWTPTGYSDPVLDWFYTYPVTQISQSDNTAVWAGTNSPGLVTRYDYDGPAWHRDDSEFTTAKTRTWDQFRGYRHVTTRTGGGSDVITKTVTDYLLGMDNDYRKDGTQRSVTVQPSTGDPIADAKTYTGMPYQSTTYSSDGGTPQVQQISRPWQSAATATQVIAGVPDRAARFVGVAQNDTRQKLADGSWRTTRVNTGYSAETGQVLTSDDLGEITSAGDPVSGSSTPRLCTSTQFARDTARNIVLPSLTIASAGACQQDIGTTTKQASRAYYDSGSLGTVSGVGNPTSTQELKTAPSTWAAAATSTFDDYGRPLTTTDPEGRATTVTYGSATTAKYLPVTLTTKNPAGWTSTVTMDPGRQVPLTTSDVNAHVTSQTYDGLGRLTQVWLANHSKSSYASTPSLKFAYTVANDDFVSVTTSTLQDSGQYSTDIVISDALLRPRQTQSTPRNNAAGSRLISNTRYDSHGWTASTASEFYNDQSAPVTTPNTTVTGSAIPMVTQTSYDGRGRTTGTQNYANGEVIATSSTTYRGEDQVESDPPDGAAPTLTTVDGRGQAVSVEENPGTTGGHDATMRYYFDALGRQVKFVGPLAPGASAASSPLTWTSSYDAQGNVITKSDPDAGTTTSTYNNDGELTSTTTTGNESGATTRVISYDRSDPAKLGRVMATYNGTVAGGKKIAAWTYDTATGKGLPATASRYSADGSKVVWSSSITGYNTLDQPTASMITIPAGAIGNTAALTYGNTNTYTATAGLLSNTVIRETGAGSLMPDERYSYTYNGQGLPVASGGIASYETNTEYDPHGRVIRAVAGAMPRQVVLTNSWDEPTGRLRTSSVSKEDGQAAVNDVDYTYNEAGQITSSSDARDGGGTTKTDTQCYRYDALQRLTDVWTDGAGTTGIQQHGVLGRCNNTSPSNASTSFTGPAPYWQSYGYDLTGNRLSRTDHAIAGTPVTTDATVSESFSGTGDVHAVRTVSRGSSVQTFGYDGGRPVSRTGVSGGQAKPADNVAYSWTIDDQLAGLIQGPAGSPTHTSSYSYDADGGHVSRTTDGVSTVQLGEDTVTVVSGVATKVVREHDFPGGVSTVRTGVPSGSGGTTGATTAQDTDAMHYQAVDPQATATTDITADSLTVSRRTYTPFGEDRDAANSGLTFAAERGFLNAPTDDVTGLTTLGARQYDPVLGQFISVDPLADSSDSQQLNGYGYAGGDPVNQTDPSGQIAGGQCGPDGIYCGHKTRGAPGSDLGTAAPAAHPPAIPTPPTPPHGQMYMGDGITGTPPPGKWQLIPGDRAIDVDQNNVPVDRANPAKTWGLLWIIPSRQDL